MIKDSGVVSHVVGCNTIPLQERMGEDGHPALSFNEGNHKGGAAGKELLEPSLLVGKQVRGFLPEHIEYIGVGGIFAGKHAKRYLEIGASGFQCGTSYYEYGERIFSDILGELVELA
jgi:dihydroorotate dehydrogenase